MKFYIGISDYDWLDYLRSQPNIDEVNFWEPSPGPRFRALDKDNLFLFQLHRSASTGNRDLMTGRGIYASYMTLPISLAWDAFEKRNGAASYSEMGQRLLRYREILNNPNEVGRRLKEEFKSGRLSYSFDGTRLHQIPNDRNGRALNDLLIWHNENRFRS